MKKLLTGILLFGGLLLTTNSSFAACPVTTEPATPGVTCEQQQAAPTAATPSCECAKDCTCGCQNKCPSDCKCPCHRGEPCNCDESCPCCKNGTCECCKNGANTCDCCKNKCECKSDCSCNSQKHRLFGKKVKCNCQNK